MVRLLTPHLDAEAEVKKIEQREANDTDGVVVMPGAAELLKSLPERQLVRRHLRHSISGYLSVETRGSAHPESADFGRRCEEREA